MSTYSSQLDSKIIRTTEKRDSYSPNEIKETYNHETDSSSKEQLELFKILSNRKTYTFDQIVMILKRSKDVARKNQ